MFERKKTERRRRRRHSLFFVICCHPFLFFILSVSAILSITLSVALSQQRISTSLSYAVNVNQTQTLLLGSDGMLNAGDVIVIETWLSNVGTLNATNVTIVDSQIVNTICQPIGMNNMIPNLDIGDEFMCIGMYIITQDDIYNQIFLLNSTIYFGTGPDPISVTSETNLTQTTFGHLTVNQMYSIDLGANNVTTAGDVVTVEVKISNTGTETLLNVSSLSFNGILVDELLPLQCVNFTYNFTLTQNDVNVGMIYVNETAIGIGTTSAMSVLGENMLVINTTQQVFQGLRTLTTMSNQQPCAAIGTILLIEVLVENSGTNFISNVMVTHDLIGTSLVCMPSGMDNTISLLFPGETQTCSGAYMLMGSDVTPGYDTLFAQETIATGDFTQTNTEQHTFSYPGPREFYINPLTGANGFTTMDVAYPNWPVFVSSVMPLCFGNNRIGSGSVISNGQSIIVSNFNVHPKTTRIRMVIIDLDFGSVQIITNPLSLLQSVDVFSNVLPPGIVNYNSNTGVITVTNVQNSNGALIFVGINNVNLYNSFGLTINSADTINFEIHESVNTTIQ